MKQQEYWWYVTREVVTGKGKELEKWGTPEDKVKHHADERQ